MANRLGIDFGTSNVRVYVKEKGVVLRVPSVIALKKQSGEVIAFGMKARDMLGKTPGNIRAIRPIRDGVIADGDVSAMLLSQIFRRIGVSSMFSRPSVLITVPSGVTAVERRAVEDAAFDAGARSVTLLDSPIAAAIGAGLKVSGARGSMIVDIGGGTSEAAILSLGGVVASSVVRLAGDHLDAAIVSYLRANRNILIGEPAAERLKLKLGTILPGTRTETAEIPGRNLQTGLATSLTVSSDEIAEALREPIETIANGVKRALEDAPPELSSDIMGTGLVLTGGSSLLPGLSKRIGECCGVRVFAVRQPLDAAVAGLGKVVEHPDHYQKLFRSGKL